MLTSSPSPNIAAFLTFVQRYALFDEAELAQVVRCLHPVALAKDQFLLRPGQVCQHYYFLTQGSCRVFYRKGEQEITGWLAFERDFFTELHSFKRQTASRFAIQALEPTELLRISALDMHTLLRSVPAWQHVVRETWEEAFLRILDGILSFQTETAEQRYCNLPPHDPLATRVPLKYLSSFLGVTPTSLSRLRRKKRP